MQELLDLHNKHYGTNLQISDYKEFHLFSMKNPTEFQTFLIKDRINPFLILRFIHAYVKKDFRIGYLNLAYRENQGIDQDDDIIEVGPCLLQIKLTKEELFDYLIGDLGLNIKVYPPCMDGIDFFTNKPIDSKYKSSIYYEDMVGRILISEDFIIAEDKIFFKKEFDDISLDFIDQLINKDDVPYEVYRILLRCWFGEKIN